MKSLAEAHLGEHNLDDAMDALCAIDDCTAADLPDHLVEAARRYLEQVNTPGFVGPSAILRQTLFDL